MFVLFSSLKAPDPFLLPGDPRLLINLPKNWLSQDHVTYKHKKTKTQYIKNGKVWDWEREGGGEGGRAESAAAVQHSPVPCQDLEGGRAGVQGGSRLMYT